MLTGVICLVVLSLGGGCIFAGAQIYRGAWHAPDRELGSVLVAIGVVLLLGLIWGMN